MGPYDRRLAAFACCGDPGHRSLPTARITFGAMKSQGLNKWMRLGLVCLLCVGMAYGIVLLIGTN